MLLPCLAVAHFSSTQKSFSLKPEEKLELSDQCFCKLEGQIDDCSCKVDTVDHFNNAKIYPRLASLLAKDFFRFFQYQPYKKCPFWDPSSGKCSSSLCQVKSCSTTDLPPGIAAHLVDQNHKKEEEEEVDNKECSDEVEDGVDSSISERELVSLSRWRKHDEAGSTFCEAEDAASCTDCVHVDLTKNPERYTGYSGPASRRVWASIYEENCFSPAGSTTISPSAFSSAFGPTQLGEMCLEKRAFYRIISGLHASITIHLAANYPIKKESPTVAFLDTSETWGPNLPLFQQRFDPSLTQGQGPYWLKNLYFVYLLELRALAKAADYLARQTFYTGRAEEDAETVQAVKELLGLVSSFPEHYDETSMFTGGRQAQELKVEFQEHFKNITRVMDCVGCDKCKLWGKLQVTGLGTALKILFSGDFDRSRGGAGGAPDTLVPPLPRPMGDLTLTRNEIVALFNAFGKISTSIVQLERFREMLRKR